MPVISWTPCPTFGAPSPSEVRAPAPRVTKRRCVKRRKRPKARAAKGITPQVRAVMIDRFEAAVERGEIALCAEDMPCDRLDFTLAEKAKLLQILFREDFKEPPPPKGATGTAPGSAARIAEYRSRAETGRGLYAAGDAVPGMVGGRGLAVESRRNGSGHRVVGWADDEG